MVAEPPLSAGSVVGSLAAKRVAKSQQGARYDVLSTHIAQLQHSSTHWLPGEA